METTTFILVLALMALLLSCWSILRFEKTTARLADWAFDNDYTLIDTQRQMTLARPFARPAGKTPVVYHIVVEDADCRRRSGYARVGGNVPGLLPDDIDVRWDDELNPANQSSATIGLVSLVGRFLGDGNLIFPVRPAGDVDEFAAVGAERKPLRQLVAGLWIGQ